MEDQKPNADKHHTEPNTKKNLNSFSDNQKQT